MDRILVTGLSLQARVGLTAAERRKRQQIRIDLELSLDLRPAGRRDEMHRTIDYAAVAAQTKQTAAARSYRLAEALAEAVAEVLLKRFRPRAVRVQVKKFSVPGTESVGVEIVRRSTRGRLQKS